MNERPWPTRQTPAYAPDASPAAEIRRLSYPDLPQVIGIERRVFPTPWSMAMFVLEMSKQSGICLAAVREGRLVGYLICSRYETVWHVMNVAVDLDRAAPRAGLGAARRALPARRRRARALHAGGAPLQPASRSICTSVRASARPGMRRRYYQDNGEDALVMWRTPATLEGSLADVPNPGPV